MPASGLPCPASPADWQQGTLSRVLSVLRDSLLVSRRRHDWRHAVSRALSRSVHGLTRCMLPQLPGLEVWFQRASDVVRKLLYGDVDLGIVGAGSCRITESSVISQAGPKKLC